MNKKYDNNFIIIASRAYFQQSPTCTRVNNLVYIWYESNTHGTEMLIMFCLWQRFSQRICDIQIHMYLAYLQVSILNIFTYLVKPEVDMLDFVVKPRLQCMSYGAGVVAEDLHGIQCARKHTKLGDELLQPISVVGSFRSSHILRLHCRLCDATLLAAFPTNSSSI